MTEERFEEFVKRTLDELDPVPPTPREEMWARLQQQRRFSKRAAAVHTRKVWVSWGAGIAATLAIGIGIGRFSATSTRRAGASRCSWRASVRPASPPPAMTASYIF